MAGPRVDEETKRLMNLAVYESFCFLLAGRAQISPSAVSSISFVAQRLYLE
jgi:hypothetical protein